ENLPPENIRNIKNEKGAKTLELILPVVSVPYSPVLITVLGLEENVDLKNISIYIGKMECDNIVYFNQSTVRELQNKQRRIESFNTNDQLYDDPHNMVIDYSQPDYYLIDDEYDETLDYLERLANISSTYKAKTLQCDLHLVNISVNYLQAQNVYIVVNQTLTVENNFFTFRDITPCPGTIRECNENGQCFSGVCLCNTMLDSGPQCNLQTSPSYPPVLDPVKPQIVYSNGQAKWTISFETLGMTKKKVEDSRTMVYNDFIDLLTPNWTLKLADQQSGVYGSEFGTYNLTLANGITFTINVLYYNNLTLDYFFDSENIKLYYHAGDLRVFFTLSNIPIELRDHYSFQLVFYVYTDMKDIECGYVDSDFDVDFGKGFDYDDVRWAYIRNKDYALYSRLFGKCIMDGRPQSCLVDINELSRNNFEGNLKLLTYFEPFSTNVSIHYDFSILFNTKNPNFTQVSCDKFEPMVHPLKWLIPTILPIIFVGLVCFILIFIYLFKANRKNLEFNTKYYFGNNFNSNGSSNSNSNNGNSGSNNNNSNNDNDNTENNNNSNNNNNDCDSYNNSYSDTDSFSESILN
ncbi:hypothetical protein DICPUDRAFT_5819, partial [Dictyostelium purpureum]